MLRTDSWEPVLAFLRQQPIINLNILGILTNVPAAAVYVDDPASPSGVLVRDGYFNYLYTENDTVLQDMVASLFSAEAYYGFAGVWRPLAEKIKPCFTVRWEESCRLYYLPPERFEPGLVRTRPQSIRLEDIAVVQSHYPYQEHDSLAKLADSIARRPSSAVYLDGEIVAWVLVHRDNSLGAMHTREAFRQRGYAVDVTVDLAGKLLAAGQIPYLQIRDDNRLSPGVARKCGFVCHGAVNWFGIAVGSPAGCAAVE